VPAAKDYRIVPDSSDLPAPRRPRRLRRMIWVVAIAIIPATAFLIARSGRSSIRYAWLSIPQERISVSQESIPADRIPADPGALAGANLVLITLDTTRAGRLRNYGNRNIQTPALDQLAAEGVLFTDAIATAPTTLPSHASILTGLYPVHHGARANGRFRLADAQETLAETLRAAGYSTAAFISAFVLDSRYGLAQGFDVYNDALRADGFNQSLGAVERRAELTTTRALTWLNGATSPFFVWVHYFDPHANYAPPQPYARQYRKNPYDGEIAYVDAQIGRLRDFLDDAGIIDRTLIVVVADHGESLAQHDELTHGYLLYDVALRVPLIMRGGPALTAGRHISRRVSIVDIAPTTLSLLGIAAPIGMDGVDLTREPVAHRRIFAETYHGWMEYGWAPLLSVHADDLKYIHGPDPELYDLAADPTERRNLINERPERAAELRTDLEKIFGQEISADATISPTEELSATELARLQALGYAFAQADEESGDAPHEPRPDPKQHIERVNRIFEITCYYNPRGMYEESIRLLEELADRYPDSYATFYNLGETYWKNLQLDKAAAAFNECIVLRPYAVEAQHRLAQLRMQQQRFDDAIALLERLLETSPDNVSLLCDLASALSSARRFREAAQNVEQAFLLDPSSRSTLRQLVWNLPRAGRTDALRDMLSEVLVDQPLLHHVRATLAAQLRQARRYDAAESVLRAGVSLAPNAPAPRAHLAWFLVDCPELSRRKPEEARGLLEEVGDLTDVYDPDVVLRTAHAWVRLNESERALEFAERARELITQQERQDLQMELDVTILEARQSARSRD